MSPMDGAMRAKAGMAKAVISAALKAYHTVIPPLSSSMLANVRSLLAYPYDEGDMLSAR